MAIAPDGNAFVVGEQNGLVFRWAKQPDESWEPDPEPILDRRDEIASAGEAGLLGLAFIEDGDRLLVSSVRRTGDLDLHVYPVTDSGKLDRDAARLIWSLGRPVGGHYGGDLEYSPDSESVFYSIGDGGRGRLSTLPSGDQASALGRVVRFPVAEIANGGTLDLSKYLVATGLRNPWRISYDHATSELWIADVGESSVEEIDVMSVSTRAEPDGRSVDFGWPAFEGTNVFREDVPVPSGHVEPVHQRAHDEQTCAIVGVGRYRGQEIPSLQGLYLFGDYCSKSLYAIDPSDTAPRESVVTTIPERLVSSARGTDDELFLLGVEGGIYRLASEGIEPSGADSQPAPQPTNAPADDLVMLEGTELRAWCRGQAAFEATVALEAIESPELRKESIEESVREMRSAIPDLPPSLRDAGATVLGFLEEVERVLRRNGWRADADEVYALSDAAIQGTGEWSALGDALSELQGVDGVCSDIESGG